MVAMGQMLEPDLPGRLEGLCERGAGTCAADTVTVVQDAPGIERLSAHLHGRPFAPHRHDTYAIGITLTGVQKFHYRGEERHCLPGQCHVLHPDELHDGAAGTEDGFGYRILYLDPSLVQRALAGRPLPFVTEPVVDAVRLPGELIAAITDLDRQIDPLAATELEVAVADALSALAGSAKPSSGRLDLSALDTVRDAIAAEPVRRYALTELERLSGLDRWALARGFRAAFGTSPTRFRTMRQLDGARRRIRAGEGLAEAALAAGFADQAHMTRHFNRAYGMTPARWSAIAG
jgi:AraC-like DNA-binding protein